LYFENEYLPFLECIQLCEYDNFLIRRKELITLHSSFLLEYDNGIDQFLIFNLVTLVQLSVMEEVCCLRSNFLFLYEVLIFEDVGS